MQTLIDVSVNKVRWRLLDAQADHVDHIMRLYDLPEIVARIICARGIEAANVPSFLNPTLKNDFPSPFLLKGMGDMAEDVAIAISEGQKFAIFGDFDVDGATSSAVMRRFLKACAVDAPVIIPDRLTEGYGPNVAALQQIRQNGAEILFILDCGTTAFDIIAAGAEMGLKIIILDHHEAEDSLPLAWHIINPKRKNDVSGLEGLAAVGVTYLACTAINNRLRALGFYAAKNIPEPDLRSYLDLVALGTVCDMVPLRGANRLFVRLGLQRIANSGMLALMVTAKITAPLSTYDCGYILGPRINAGGRIEKSDLGARLLCLDDAQEVKNIAWMLHDCNEKRKSIQQEMEREAIDMVQQNGMEDAPLIFVESENWHTGLSGLVAGRLKEKYKRPACVVAYAENQDGIVEGRGSGRSIAGVHIAQAFIDARHAGLLEKGGGHAMAGGFTVNPKLLAPLKAFLIDHVRRQMQGFDASHDTIVDAVLSVQGASVDLIELLGARLAPFGQENPEPLFCLRDVRIYAQKIAGENHIQCQLGDYEGGQRIKAVAFRALDTPLGDFLQKSAGVQQRIDVLGTLKVNDWMGRKTPEFHIQDAAMRIKELI